MSYLARYQHLVATRPKVLGSGYFDGTRGLWILDNGDFAWDATAVTPVLDFIGGRPCVNLTNSGSTATDGAQFQVVTGCYQFQAAKKVHLFGSVRGTTVDQDWSFGWAALDTSVVASEPTDHAAWQKLAAATQPSVRMRKASGTAQATNALNLTFAANTWYDWEMIVTRDPSTAGVGRVQLYMASGVNPGDPIGSAPIYEGTFGSQVPDTVDLAPYGAFRAGSAANVSCYLGHFGWLIEA